MASTTDFVTSNTSLVKASQLTIFGLGLINAMLANRYYSVSINTTLNEKFGILTNEHTPKGTLLTPIYPRLKYLVIGNGGIPVADDATSYRFSQHCAIDGALFNHLPFALKTPSEDFNDVERRRYRLRKEVRIDGELYYAYYARVVETIDYRGYPYLITHRDGVDVLSVFNTNIERILNPRPVIKPDKPLDSLRVDTVINRFKLEFFMSEKDQEELQNVYKLLKINKYTKLTEIGVCHGYDVIVPYGLEVADTQISYFLDIDLDVALEFDARAVFKRNLELGGAEPFYVI